MTKHNYENLTVTGLICTGTSTLAQALHKVLKWEYWDAGNYTREYCRQYGLKLEETEARNEEFSQKIEMSVKKRLQTKKNLIHEGWLAGFVARGIPGVLKILLIAPDELRIDRLANRDNITIGEAIKLIKMREENNFRKWSRMYRAKDFWDPQYYDLVIDTYSNSKEETLTKVLAKLGYAIKKEEAKQAFTTR
jgi:predicted cytidylate kinase